MKSLSNELAYLFSGQGMPYAKVSLLVAMACAIIFTLFFGNNTIHEGPVAVIDLDNSAYSRTLTEKIDASPFIHVDTILHEAQTPESLLYNDSHIAVIYMPPQLEKEKYATGTAKVGVFYDNTSAGQSGEIKAALNEIIGMEQGVTLEDRLLFNPSGSAANNGSVQGFLFFFSSMFFVFATIGMIPRLRLTGEYDAILRDGSPWDLLIRLIPYGMCLLSALVIGMVVLHFLNDMRVAGNILLFYSTQVLYIFSLGMMSLLFGWTAANPGVASSRMILFIPGGFILGGTTAPIQELSSWVKIISHVFPLRWEYEFTRDILVRGAGMGDIAQTLGFFLLYIAVILILFHIVFYQAQKGVNSL